MNNKLSDSVASRTSALLSLFCLYGIGSNGSGCIGFPYHQSSASAAAAVNPITNANHDANTQTKQVESSISSTHSLDTPFDLYLPMLLSAGMSADKSIENEHEDTDDTDLIDRTKMMNQRPLHSCNSYIHFSVISCGGCHTLAIDGKLLFLLFD